MDYQKVEGSEGNFGLGKWYLEGTKMKREFRLGIEEEKWMFLCKYSENQFIISQSESFWYLWNISNILVPNLNYERARRENKERK